MSNGNAEQPTAQAPRGHSSPNRVEVSEEGRQGAPASNAQGQESSNGQSKELREEQLAKAPAGAAAARAVERRVGPPPRSLLGLPPVRSRPLVRAREGLRALRRSTRNSNRRSRPRRNRRRSRRRNRSRVRHRRPSRSKCMSPPAQLQPQPQTGGQAASASAQTQPRHSIAAAPGAPDARSASGAVPVWDPPPPPAPKQGLWTRLGFGRNAERPEGATATPPAQQPRVPPTQPAPTTPGGPMRRSSGRSDRSGRAADWSAGAAAPDARGSAWDAGRAQPGARPGPQPGGPVGPGAAAAAGLAAAGVHPSPSAGAGRPAWHGAAGTRPPKRADRPYARSPRRSTCFPSRPSFRTASARAHRTGRSSHADAGAADAACRSGCNPGTGPGEGHS